MGSGIQTASVKIAVRCSGWTYDSWCSRSYGAVAAAAAAAADAAAAAAAAADYAM